MRLWRRKRNDELVDYVERALGARQAGVSAYSQLAILGPSPRMQPSQSWMAKHWLLWYRASLEAGRALPEPKEPYMSLIDDLNALNAGIDSLKPKIQDALNSAYAASASIDPAPVVEPDPAVQTAPADEPSADPSV